MPNGRRNCQPFSICGEAYKFTFAKNNLVLHTDCVAMSIYCRNV